MAISRMSFVTHLLMRGSRDFDDIGVYGALIYEIVSRHNANHGKRIDAEPPSAGTPRLPHQRLREGGRERVGKGGPCRRNAPGRFPEAVDIGIGGTQRIYCHNTWVQPDLAPLI